MTDQSADVIEEIQITVLLLLEIIGMPMSFNEILTQTNLTEEELLRPMELLRGENKVTNLQQNGWKYALP